MDKADSAARKLIRSHCMRGKNRGRILRNTRKDKTATQGSNIAEPPLARKTTSVIPSKVGSEVSLLQFADSIDPSTLLEVLKCK
jgi:hypothetical protein